MWITRPSPREKQPAGGVSCEVPQAGQTRVSHQACMGPAVEGIGVAMMWCCPERLLVARKGPHPPNDLGASTISRFAP